MTLLELLKELQAQDEKSLVVIHLLEGPKLTDKGREMLEILNRK